jgi:hypothetical protein
MPADDPKLLAAITDTTTKAGAFTASRDKAFQGDLPPLKAASDALRVECAKYPAIGMNDLLDAADKARTAMDTSYNAVLANYETWASKMGKAAGLAVQYVPPVPPTPTIVYGCPEGMALANWVFKPVDGAGKPPGIPEFVAGAHLTGFRFTSNEGGDYAGPQGIASGQVGIAENVKVSNAIIDGAAKWHARPHKVKGLTWLSVSDLNGPEEHDIYIEPIGGQPVTAACFLLKNSYSLRCGSQRLQVAQRTEDGVTEAMYVDGGMIAVKNDKCVDHARHQSEGGTGTRCSQAYKVFSAQVGPDEAHRTNRILKHWVLFDGIDLDDTMQTLSHGFALIGANNGAVIRNSKARGGRLTHATTSYEAIRVESFIPGTDGSTLGPLLIENCHLEYTSGSGGPGIALLDKRPVMIRNCTGNLRVQNSAGAIIGMVKDGFSFNWTAAAQATADKIIAAGAAL